jgi:hypothetical protein
MHIDHNIIESLMRWAQAIAPYDETAQTMLRGKLKRPVRLELTSEPWLPFPTPPISTLPKERILCRVYLAEPRGLHELHPLQETRIA